MRHNRRTAKCALRPPRATTDLAAPSLLAHQVRSSRPEPLLALPVLAPPASSSSWTLAPSSSPLSSTPRTARTTRTTRRARRHAGHARHAGRARRHRAEVEPQRRPRLKLQLHRTSPTEPLPHFPSPHEGAFPHTYPRTHTPVSTRTHAIATSRARTHTLDIHIHD